MVVSMNVNNTEILVLRTLSNYHSSDVPQIIFKQFDNSTIKKALKSLKDKNMISKKCNMKDMRQVFVNLTDYGIEVYETISN